ncbi:MAG: DUF4962 domain-containing protein [Bryobacteraceae bacterium]
MIRNLIASVLLGAALYGAPPAVSNRAPGPDDIGYLPADGASVETNPPALAWLPEPGAKAYAVQFARDSAFGREVLTIAKTPYVLYTHTAVMSPGKWFWRYATLDDGGQRSAWGPARSFTIAADAQAFPRPSEEIVKTRMPRQHPRLMLRPEELAGFRRARTGTQEERWNVAAGGADRYLKTDLIQEPRPWTGGKWNAPEWRANYSQASRAVEIAETLAFCYMLSGDRRYGEGARKWLMHVSSWDPLGTTSMEVNDEAGMPILHIGSRAYDWAYEALTEADREKLRAVFRVRGEEAYHRLRNIPHEQRAYHSHAGRMWHFLGEAAIAYYGEIPEARTWLDYALTIFWSWYPAYGDEDGGWGQGFSYWNSYVNRSTWWLDALNAALQVDGTEKPFYRHVGDFPLYIAPPGGALVGFGDFAEQRPRGQQAIPVSFFARLRNKPEWQWYAEAWGKGDGAPGPIGFLRAARPGPVPVAKAPSDWPAAKLFRGAGWATMHTNLLDGASDVQIAFRSAALGNISHSHSDQNAIVLGAFGSPLLVNTGIRPWYGSPFCKEWYWTTKAHNALEIDGRGQPKTGEAKGSVIVFRPGAGYDYVAGEVASGYGDHVERYRRHLVFLKPEVLVMVDEVRAKKPVPLKMWLHGLAPFAIDAAASRISLEFEKAALTGYLLAPGGLKIDQTDKYPIPPEQGTTRPEWHLSAETAQSRASTYIISVLGISRAGEKVELNNLEDVSNAGHIGVSFRRSGKAIAVRIETAGPTVNVE